MLLFCKIESISEFKGWTLPVTSNPIPQTTWWHCPIKAYLPPNTTRLIYMYVASYKLMTTHILTVQYHATDIIEYGLLCKLWLGLISCLKWYCMYKCCDKIQSCVTVTQMSSILGYQMKVEHNVLIWPVLCIQLT